MKTNRPARRSALAVLLAALVATGCTSIRLSEPVPRMTTIAGTASYRERIALPPNAVFEVRLEEATAPNAPAVVLGSARVDKPQTPIAFSLGYDAARIQPGRRYLLRASIAADGRPLFAGEAPLPTDGAQRVQMLLLSVAPAPAPKPPVLENTVWRLVALKGQAVPAQAGWTNEPHFLLQPEEKRVTGASGCNRMLGSYRLDGPKLSFGQLAGTMMACADGMALERDFLDTLMDVAAWRLAGQRLELLDERGQVLAQFEPRPGE